MVSLAGNVKGTIYHKLLEHIHQLMHCYANIFINETYATIDYTYHNPPWYDSK